MCRSCRRGSCASCSCNSTQGKTRRPRRYSDIRVRKAIMHAIDREAMVKSIVGEGSRVCMPSASHRSSAASTKGRRAMPTTRQRRGAAGRGRNPNGLDLEFYAYQDRNHTEAMIGYLRAVGIRTSCGSCNMQRRAMPAARQTPLSHQSWGSFSVNDVSAATPNFFKFTLETSRAMRKSVTCGEGDTSTDGKVRADAYARALGLIQERAYAMPMYSLPARTPPPRSWCSRPTSTNSAHWEMHYK